MQGRGHRQRPPRARAERDGLEKAATALGLARKQNDALVPRGQSIGDLGASAAVETTVYALPVGGLSEPVRTPAGWAVVRVLEKKDYDKAAFEKEKAALTSCLSSSAGASSSAPTCWRRASASRCSGGPDASRRVAS